MQVEDEVALIYCGTKGLLADVPVEKVKDFEKNFLQLMHARNQDAMDAIRAGRLDDDITALLTAAATEVAASYK